jgi:hypothetical protein
MLISFLALSKPIEGGFRSYILDISKIMSYERNIRTYMIISDFGIFLIFAANQQAIVQIVSPYPSFGLSSITVLNIATFLMLLGIYKL